MSSTISWEVFCAQPNTLGESPFWHPNEARLYWVDIPGQQVLRQGLHDVAPERWNLPQEPGCIAPARSGGLVLALRDGIYRAPVWGGELHLLHAATHDTATARFNDGRCDPVGRFWAGSIYEPRTAALAELWCLDARGPAPLARRMAGDVTVANGLAWSPDARWLYWSDTTAHTVYRFDWRPTDAPLGPRQAIYQVPRKPPAWRFDSDPLAYSGRPDGAAVDIDGCYWVAMFEGAQLHRLSPDGQLLALIPTPVQCPTMPCFGGEDLRTLFLTTGRHNRPAEELAAQPHAGCVFSLRVDTPGLPVSFFAD